MPSSRPQILFLAHRIPFPPNRGDRIRSYHLIRFLAEHADVHLAFLADDEVLGESQRALERICKRVTSVQLHRRGRWVNALRCLALGRTATEGLFASSELIRELDSWTKTTRFDAAFVFCSSMVQYLQADGLRDVPAVVDLVDVDSQKWFDYADKSRGPKRWLLGLEGRRLRRLEAQLPEQVKAITVVTPQEADVYQSFRADYRPCVIRNGVDLEYFKPEGHGVNGREVDGLSAVFVGALDYQANVDGAAWFCHEIWPDVRLRFPHARFQLVGSRPSAKAIRLGELPGVELVGEVPDVRPYLRDATIVTVPLRIARGIQNKVLEALAAGKPLVVSPQGLEGIDASPGRDLMKAETPSQWVESITRLFDSPAQREAMGRAGRLFVEREYCWSTQLERLHQIPGLDGLLSAPQRNELAWR